MKRLTLIRHAKASWGSSELTDFERPLDDQGRRDAPMVARQAAIAFGTPGLWISSPAHRAITTARLFAETLALSTVDVLQDADIYNADVEHLFKLVSQLPATAAQVWLFGHNPGLSDLSHLLNTEAPPDLSPCAAVSFDLPIAHWSALRPGLGRIVGHLDPMQLPR